MAGLAEGACDDRADDAAGDGDQDRVIAGADPAVTARRGVQAIAAIIVDHAIVGRIATVESLPLGPAAMIVVADHRGPGAGAAVGAVLHDQIERASGRESVGRYG